LSRKNLGFALFSFYTTKPATNKSIAVPITIITSPKFIKISKLAYHHYLCGVVGLISQVAISKEGSPATRLPKYYRCIYGYNHGMIRYCVRLAFFFSDIPRLGAFALQ
jgi:hypothetical protein